MNNISGNINNTTFGYNPDNKKIVSTGKKIVSTFISKLTEPPVTFIKAEDLKNTKRLVLPTVFFRIKRGSVTDKILSVLSKSFREQ